MDVELSIIIPTYNERENLKELLNRIESTLKARKVLYEVVIVDDNSPDGTAEYAQELSKIYPVKVLKRPGKLGLSTAVLDGLKLAEGRFIAVMDADLQHPPEVLPKMLEKLQKCDVVIASRYVKGGSVGKWSFSRRLISKGASLIARILLPKVRSVRDPMSGYFMFRREVIDDILNELRPRGYKILLEILVRGKIRKVCEVPYTFQVRYKGESKLGKREIVNYISHVLNLVSERTRFAIVGTIGMAVNLGILALLRYVLGIPHVAASAIAIEVSTLNNFMFSDTWMIKKGGWWHRLLKFHASAATTILAQWVVSNIFYYMVLNSSLPAQLLGILVSIALNYL